MERGGRAYMWVNEWRNEAIKEQWSDALRSEKEQIQTSKGWFSKQGLDMAPSEDRTRYSVIIVLTRQAC